MGKYLDSSGLTTLWSKVKNGLNLKLDKTGGTLTGPLTLSGAPSADLQAATKQYVDDSIPANLSDLTNDSGFITNSAIATKADKSVPAVAGNFAALDASGNLSDSGKVAADFEASGTVSTHDSSILAHSALFTEKQNKITTSGILKGNGSGTVSAAVRGKDFSLVNAQVTVSVPNTGWVQNSATGAYEQSVAVAGLLTTDDKRTRVEPVGSTDVDAQVLIDAAMGCVSYVACTTNGRLYMRCDSAAPETTFSVAVVIAR